VLGAPTSPCFGRQASTVRPGEPDATYRAIGRGFTLVELLVVVAIIALLISILLPSLIAAKNYVWRVRCGTNIRQLMTATLLYAQENRDAMPMPNWASQDPAHGWLYKPPHLNWLPEYRERGLIWPYLLNGQLYRCGRHLKPYKPLSSENLTSYLMNGAVAGYGRQSAAFQVTRFRTGSLIFWEAEETLWNDGASYPSEGLTRRHGAGATLGGIDGHTEWMTHQRYLDEVNREGPGKLWCAPDKDDGR
jgi:prepilin-type N-terminal cleavage/methylation domain-containing protein